MVSRRSTVLALALVTILPAFALAQIPELPGHVPLAPSAPAPAQLLTLEDETVTLIRTAEGVPHVYAATPFGLGFGNGYAQAQDRLFMLDILRHVGKGDSAAIVGEGQLASDLEVRRELYTDAERQATYEALPAFEKTLFDGYAAGVNRFIEEALADPLKLDTGFYGTAHAPEPWAATDTLAIAQYLLDTFGSAGGQELANAKLLVTLMETVGDDASDGAFTDAVWLRHNQATSAIPSDEGTYHALDHETVKDFGAIPAEQQAATWAAARAEPFGAGESLVPLEGKAAPFKFKWGSNAVIVSPHLAKNGGGVLGGGPQMGYYSPSVPYEIGLHGAGFDVAGIGVSGAPGIVIGRTGGFSWTVTSGIADQVDVVAEKLVPGNARQYYFEGEVRDMDCRTEVHVVKSQPPTSGAALLSFGANVVHQEVCRTIHGPVFAMDPNGEYAFSKERSHRGMELESGLRWLLLGMQTDLDGFRERLSDFAFTFNFHYVDADNLYFQHTGYQPVRDARLDPRLPRPGTGEYEWQGTLTGADLPHTLNPSKGWIVNWNNLPQKGFPSGDSREAWGSMHRVDLLKTMIEKQLRDSSDGKLDMEAVADAVEAAATHDPFARRTVPHLLAAIAQHGDARAQQAKAHLADWKHADYAWAADASGNYTPAHAIYDAWREALQNRTFADEMGDEMRTPINFDPPTSDDPHGGDHAQHGNKDAILLDVLEGRSRHAWCDDQDTDAPESCPAQLLAALHEALMTLESEYGTADMAAWTMPQHLIRFVAISAGPAWEFPMVNRASFNHLHDWGIPDNADAQSVLPPGAFSGSWPPLVFADFAANGNVPDHRRDQLDLYEAFEYKPFRYYRADVEDGADSITELHTALPTGLAETPPTP